MDGGAGVDDIDFEKKVTCILSSLGCLIICLVIITMVFIATVI